MLRLPICEHRPVEKFFDVAKRFIDRFKIICKIGVQFLEASARARQAFLQLLVLVGF